MSKLILMALLAVVSSSAMAQWFMVSPAKEKRIYIDTATAHTHDNNIVKLSVLIDYDKPQETNGIRYMSKKLQQEFNCAEGRARTINVTYLSESMGAGEMIFSDSEVQHWYPLLSLNSAGKRTWKFACGMQQA